MIAEIRDGIKTRLETISGLRCHDTVPSDVMVPAAVVAPVPDTFVTYDVAMDNINDLAFTIVLVVSKAWDRTAQDLLDSFIDPTGPRSVYAALRADPTLGGLVDTSALRTAGNYGMITWGERQQYLGIEFLFEVNP